MNLFQSIKLNKFSSEQEEEKVILAAETMLATSELKNLPEILCG